MALLEQMKIYNHINEFSGNGLAVVTIGTFDGVHFGHQKIISKLKEIARQTSGETVILTFFPHPRMILHPEDVNLKLLSTINEKAALLEKLGINHLIITPFTRDFSNLSPEEYIKQILVDQIGTKKIVIGYDHRFGKDREGGLAELQKFAPVYSFDVEEIPEQDIHDVAVSSTRIRGSLLAGDVLTAGDFLGYPFHITGKVIKGDQIGRRLGFPTANLFIEESYKLIPADGIYAVLVELVDENKEQGVRSKEQGLKSKEQGARSTDDGADLKPSTLNLKPDTSYLIPNTSHLPLKKGMAYIGHRPTINGMTRNIEVNIFDFNEDIYGKMIRLHFLDFIRGDEKFNSLDELKTQLGKDEIVVKKLLFDY